MVRPRTWTDDEFRQAVLGPPPATSLFQVTRRLGLRQGGPTNKVLFRHAERLGLELPNGWDRNPPPPMPIASPLANYKRPTPSGVDGGGKEE